MPVVSRGDAGYVSHIYLLCPTMSLAFNRTYRYLVNLFPVQISHRVKSNSFEQQRQAHEQPVLFWSVVLGGIGPVMAFSVPRIRESYFGYTRQENVPSSFPRAFMLGCQPTYENLTLHC